MVDENFLGLILADIIPGLDKCLEKEYSDNIQISKSACFVNFINPTANLTFSFTFKDKDIFVKGKYNNDIDL